MKDDAIKELALKLSAVIARERNDLNWAQLYLALALCILDVMRSCDCPRCRERVMRHVRLRLPKELAEASEYAKDKYFGAVVSH